MATCTLLVDNLARQFKTQRVNDTKKPMMEMLPKITIITPSFNQGHFIEQTIQSVIDQSYPDLEYIVMDGGSTDNTLDILRKYEGQLLWISEPDRGQTHAINKGLQRASGEVIAYLNSDDLYETGALLKVGEYFRRHPSACWVTGKCRVINPQGREIRRAITLYKIFWLLWKSYTLLQILDYISQPATFWRQEVIEKVGQFDESLHLAMDYDYSLRVGQRYKLSVINEYLASFRVHPTSKSETSLKAHFGEDLDVAKIHTSKRLNLRLHALHNALIVNVYRLMMRFNSANITSG